MSEPSRPLLADLGSGIGSLAAELRESLRLRWQLARLEVQSDLRSMRQLAIVLGVVAGMALTSLPLLAGCLARLLDGRLGVSVTGWLAIFGFGLLIFGGAGGYLAWRRFRRRFVGLEQTLEELREDVVWLGEWTSRDDGDRDA